VFYNYFVQGMKIN